MSIRAELARARTTPPRDLLLASEAFGWLGALRVAVALVPLRRLASLLGVTPAEPSLCFENVTERTDVEDRIGWAIRASSGRTPWESTCLVQALAGLAMLRVRGLDGTIFLGIARTADGEVAAHSWLRRGDRLVTGGANRATFTAVAAYRRHAGRSTTSVRAGQP